MKVIFVTREGYGLSGARVRCYGFARQLKLHGFETQVLSFADDLGGKYGEEEYEMSFIYKARLNLAALKILLSLGKEDVVFLQRFNYHAVAPLLASFIKKCKVVFDCDDWNIRENPVYYWRIPSSKMEYLTRKTAKYSTACIAASSYLKDYLAAFNKNVWEIPTGVDADIFFPRKIENKEKIIFSWVGTVFNKEMKDNLIFLLDCFSQTCKKFDNVLLKIAARGSYYDQIIKQISRLEFSGKIELGPWVNPDDMPEYLSNIDIGLLPLIQDSRFNKAKSPTKLFEYMSMGKPTISSNLGEAARILGKEDCGLLAGSRADFINQMCRLAGDNKLREELGLCARERVLERYSFKKIGLLLKDIISNL